ncbi:transposase [Sphingobium sp. B11D3D]|nr:transposase [Sphingobium sp. B11D3D]
MGRCAGLLWAEEDALQPVRALGGEGRVAGAVHCAGSRRWATRRGSDRQHPHEGAPLRERRKRGALVQAIGISRGGRNSKLHALTDGEGPPLRFLLTGGQVADCRAADVLLDDPAPRTIVLADKAYDSNAIRDLIERQGAVPNIPSKANRRWKSCFSKTLYKNRNAVERMFCRLKDYRRIATRYDKLATNFLSAIYLAAAVTWWL